MDDKSKIIIASKWPNLII